MTAALTAAAKQKSKEEHDWAVSKLEKCSNTATQHHRLRHLMHVLVDLIRFIVSMHTGRLNCRLLFPAD